MKKALSFVVVSVLALGLCACNVTINKTEEEPKIVGMANPWRDCTEDEAYQYGPNGFSAPEGAQNVHWSLMLPDNDPNRESDTMVQMKFELDGIEYTAREQASGDDSDTDISGIYCEWQTTESVTLNNWAGGMMPAIIKTSDAGEESAKLCIWYDFFFIF